MPKVLCPAVECVHYKDGRCTAEEVPLRQWQINTMYEGRKTVWECKAYEQTDEWKELQKDIRKRFGEWFREEWRKLNINGGSAERY